MTDGVSFTQLATVGTKVTTYSNTQLDAHTRSSYCVHASLTKAINSDYTNGAGATTPQ